MKTVASGMPSSSRRAARERTDAARALLANPILTAAEHFEELALVRKHLPALRNTFAVDLGYTLVVESTFARLTKTPVSADAPARPGRRAGDGREFTPTIYRILALLCGALLSPHTGEQILISALIEQVRADAANEKLPFSDSLDERRALVTAITQLITWGVLTETEGTAAAWSERREEVLLTVNRTLLPQLLARRMGNAERPADLLVDDAPPEPRKSLRRKLVENPLVRREDLTDAERDVLSRERRELERVLDDHYGLKLEVRLEGALAYDPDSLSGASDLTFPGRGTVPWATLLLLEELRDRLEPVAGQSVTMPDGQAVAGAYASLEIVTEVMGELTNRYGKAWGAADAADLPRLTSKVLAFAEQLSLVRRVPASMGAPHAGAAHTDATGRTAAPDEENAAVSDDDGRPINEPMVAGHPRVGEETPDGDGWIVVHPVIGRYRALPTTSAPTRAQRRHAPDGQDELFAALKSETTHDEC